MEDLRYFDQSHSNFLYLLLNICIFFHYGHFMQFIEILQKFKKSKSKYNRKIKNSF